MNRTVTLLLTSVIICIIIVPASLANALNSSYKTIASSGFIKENAANQSIIRTFIASYSTTIDSETATFIASYFDLVDFSFGSTLGFEKIKALNPNVILIGYRNIMAMYTYYEDWAEVNLHEDWFLHDLNGNRLVHTEYGWYAMDVGNMGWQKHYANFVKAKLDAYPMVDGIFADDAWEEFRTDVWLNNAVPDPSIAPRWYNDMVGFLRYVKNAIGDKLLIPNTRDLTQNFVNETDGMMWEGFAHAPWHAEYFYDKDFVLQQINLLSNISRRGKFFLACSGTIIPDNPTQEDLQTAHDIMLYCLACFLLGVNGPNASFGWNSIHSKDGSRGYYPEFDVSLGSPVNEYYSVGSVYARDFAGGKVLVNPTTSIYTVKLDGEYKTLDGQRVSNVTLDAHSGIILLGP
jgi:hypothetical protein